MAGTSRGAIILLVRGDLLSQGCGTITAQQSWSQLAGTAGKILDPDVGHTLVHWSHTLGRLLLSFLWANLDSQGYECE